MADRFKKTLSQFYVDDQYLVTAACYLGLAKRKRSSLLH